MQDLSWSFDHTYTNHVDQVWGFLTSSLCEPIHYISRLSIYSNDGHFVTQPHEYVGPDGWFVYASACLKNLEKLRLECFMDFL